MTSALSRICVTPPYRAFDTITHDDKGTVSGFVRTEQPLGRERGPITGAEAGRHLAILGSCAAALANPRGEKHYYLATAAHLVRVLDPGVTLVAREPLIARATASLVSRREARADCVLEASGDGVAAVYTLAVTYAVLTANVFARVFRDRADERARHAEPPQNPYARLRTPEIVACTPTRIVGAAETVGPEDCPGHFDGYPALPVAVVMHRLAALAGELLALRLTGPAHVVQAASVRANALAWAGDTISYTVEHIADDGPDAQFLGRAVTTAGVEIGEMALMLRRPIPRA